MTFETLVKLTLNISLVFALLISPIILLMANWYRRRLSPVVMVWKKNELVMATIFASIMNIVFFIVAVSCFFTANGYLESSQVQSNDLPLFFDLGLGCVLMMVAVTFIYLSVRLLLVQIVTHEGIIQNDNFLRIPNMTHVVEWTRITDYYIVSDYPNEIVNLIVQSKDRLKFTRIAIRVPGYLRDKFEDMLEFHIYTARNIQSTAEAAWREQEN